MAQRRLEEAINMIHRYYDYHPPKRVIKPQSRKVKVVHVVMERYLVDMPAVAARSQ